MKSIIDFILAIIYVIKGEKPFSLGYRAYKERKIKKILYSNNYKISENEPIYRCQLDERIVEYPWLFSRLPDREGTLLDAGSALNFEYLLNHQLLANKKIFIITLAPEKYAFWKKGISYIYQDMRTLCLRDEYFDYIVSLSTIEHIGLDNTLYHTSDLPMKEDNPESFIVAIKEFRRTLKPGGRLLLTVPFGQYSKSSWMQVFNAEMIQAIITAFKPDSISEKYFRYADDQWKETTKEESKYDIYVDYRVAKYYGGSVVAAQSVACLELIK